MKNILLICTGGTITSHTDESMGVRVQSSETVKTAGDFLTKKFKGSSSKYRDTVITDAKFPEERTTLSESMTLEKLSEIIGFIKTAESDSFDGIIILHGTDTLAYTASLFSFVFCETKIPIFLVSGNRPATDPQSNAVENFISAVELISQGIAPNIYVTYRNADNKMRLYLGSTIMQSPNFSEDFFGADKSKVFEITQDSTKEVLKLCCEYSQSRKPNGNAALSKIEKLSNKILLIHPYTGLDYSMLSATDCAGVVHGTYHSGTVSLPGLVLRAEAQKQLNSRQADIFNEKADAEEMSVYSIRYFAEYCKKNGIPLFIAPSHLGIEQYETMSVVDRKTDAVLLNMTTESAYAKLIVALTCKMSKDEAVEYMKQSINNEFIEL